MSNKEDALVVLAEATETGKRREPIRAVTGIEELELRLPVLAGE
jgi:hypothetical protein